MRTWVPFFAFWVTAVNLLPVPVCPAMPSSWPPIQETVTGRATARPLGTIKIMAGNVITGTPDYGPEIGVMVEAATRVVHIAPQEKTLNYATPVQLKNLQVGDRILLAGKACDDAKAIVATSGGGHEAVRPEAHKDPDRPILIKTGNRPGGKNHAD